MTLTDNTTPTPKKRVVVAMSGGVDSSVVAALLHEAGHEVIGLTMQLYDHGAAVAKKGACCAGQDIHDARDVADRLGIPHYVLDYESRFREAVIDAFADSYLAGETPIPCVMCNAEVKFKDLLDTARDLGADALATGHYIARRETGSGPELVRARDAGRDQSYFLFTTTREQLDLLMFPLGDMPKSEVREHARRFGLPVAEKSDSQDICFVPDGRYADVIAKLRPDALTPGDIRHVDGRTLGQHDGIVNYTVGQRRGLGVATGQPLYVVRIDRETNAVIVGPREWLDTHELDLREVNWIGNGELSDLPADGLEIEARIRSTAPPVPATLFAPGADAPTRVRFHAPIDGVATGQACVFYADSSPRARVLGGGWISATRSDAAVRHEGEKASSATPQAETAAPGTRPNPFLSS